MKERGASRGVSTSTGKNSRFSDVFDRGDRRRELEYGLHRHTSSDVFDGGDRRRELEYGLHRHTSRIRLSGVYLQHHQGMIANPVVPERERVIKLSDLF